MFTFRSLELAEGGLPGQARWCLDLVEGFSEPSDVRGKDWIVPRLDGRQAGNRRRDVRPMQVYGFIEGLGATPDERREGFRAGIAAVMAVMDHSLDPGTIVLSDGYLGLPTGSEAQIEARCLNAAGGKLLNGQSYQLWTFTLQSIDPEWDIGS